MSNFEKSIYINHNYNRNKIIEVLAENNLAENYVENWVNATEYYVGKRVYSSQNDKFYECNSQHISGSSINDDINRWTHIIGADFRKMPLYSEKGLFYFDTFLNRLVVWDGTKFKIVRYLDEDFDITINKNDIQLNDVWLESNQIPTVESIAASSSILYKHVDIVTEHIPNSYSFKVPVLTASPNILETRLAINSIIPEEYDPFFYTTGISFYSPKLKTYDNKPIPPNYRGWKLLGDTITFYDGFMPFSELTIDKDHPPIVTFYEYIGTRLDSIIALDANNRIFQISGAHGTISGTNFLLPLPTYATKTSDVINVWINGLMIFNNYQINTPNVLTIDMNGIGYDVDSGDLIYVELKQPV